MEKKQKQIVKKAKQMREESTKSVEILWNMLKNNSWGLKFLRKEAIGEVIVDFYCPKAKLAIDIDGNMHLPSKKEKPLKALGITYVRYSSQEVQDFPDSIEIHIAQMLG